MKSSLPSLSTDQVSAFVELARHGSLRAAAEGLHITGAGLAESFACRWKPRLGASLYRKSRGPRRAGPLTEAGQLFLPHAVAFLEQGPPACAEVFGTAGPRELHVAATQYLILYVLIDAVRRFHRAHPHIHVRLSNHTEQEIEAALIQDPELALGVAALRTSRLQSSSISTFSRSNGV